MALSFEALRRLLRDGGALLLLRADLAAEELAWARSRWIGWLIIAASAIALIAVAVAAAGAWMTLVLWDRFGAATLGMLALAFAAGGIALMWALGRAVRTAPPALQHTRNALREDAAAIAAATSERRGEVG